MQKIVVYRNDERMVGTAEEISNHLGMRLYVFNRFLKNGKAYNNPRLKGVRFAKDEKPVPTKAAEPTVDVPKRAPRENISKKMEQRHRFTQFEKDNLYLGSRGSYALCIEANHGKNIYKFIAVYNTPDGFKLASAANELAVTTTNKHGISSSGIKLMYQIDINSLTAGELKEFIDMRNWLKKRAGQPTEVLTIPTLPVAPAAVKVIEEIKQPSVLDMAVILDRIKNLETEVTHLRGKQ